jgi:hypothetical protein
MRTSHPNTPHSADPSVTLHDVSFTLKRLGFCAVLF